jgi:hypothetical protein
MGSQTVSQAQIGQGDLLAIIEAAVQEIGPRCMAAKSPARLRLAAGVGLGLVWWRFPARGDYARLRHDVRAGRRQSRVLDTARERLLAPATTPTSSR